MSDEITFRPEAKTLDLLNLAKTQPQEIGLKNVKVKAVVIFMDTAECETTWAIQVDGYDWKQHIEG